MSEVDDAIDQIESHAALAREQKLRAELDDLKSVNARLRGLISTRDADTEQLWEDLRQEVDERNKMRADNVRLRERLRGSDMLAHVRGEQIERLQAALREYGKHKGTCNDHGGHDCNCGWEKTRRALSGEQEKTG